MQILHIISSPRGAASTSSQLADSLIEKLVAANPGSTVKTHDLAKHPLPYFEEIHLQSFYTPAESRTPEQQAALRHSDEAIAEVIAADTLIISTPLYNFGLPASLKAWIDQVARAGVTFRYTADGFEGLVTGKKAYLVLSSGSVLSASNDFASPHLNAILNFLGITDVTHLRLEGTAVGVLKEEAFPKALASINL